MELMVGFVSIHTINLIVWMELDKGLEPLTSRLQITRSAN